MQMQIERQCVIVTHEVSEAPNRQPTGAGDKLQQPHPLLVVRLLYELQDKDGRKQLKTLRRHKKMTKTYSSEEDQETQTIK